MVIFRPTTIYYQILFAINYCDWIFKHWYIWTTNCGQSVVINYDVHCSDLSLFWKDITLLFNFVLNFPSQDFAQKEYYKKISSAIEFPGAGENTFRLAIWLWFNKLYGILGRKKHHTGRRAAFCSGTDSHWPCEGFLKKPPAHTCQSVQSKSLYSSSSGR